MTTKKAAREERRARLAAARAAASDIRPAADRGASGWKALAITREQALAALALAGMVLASFYPALQAGFVWDDVAFTEQPMVLSVSGIRDIWLSPREMSDEGHYWPMTYTSFWLEHKIWGLNPLGYHLVNVLLHLANVLLIWRLLGRFAVPGAWVVAAVFAVHPLHVESVAWVIERKDVLSGFFYLTAFLLYVRCTESRSRWRYAVALALFVLALLSKTVVVTLPAAFVIWHWWRRGAFVGRDLLRTAPFFAVGLTIALADTAFYRTREVLTLDYTFIERVIIAARALWFYAGKLVWPGEQAVIYPLWEIRADSVVAWAYVLGAVLLPAVLILGRARWGRGPIACAAFFAVTLSPALGVIDYGYMQFSLVADRFQYLAGIGFLTLMVGAAATAVGRLPAAWVRFGLRGGQVLLAVVLTVLGALTFRHAARFQDSLTLFSHIVSLNPEARGAHLNLSSALNQAGQYEESLEAALVALERNPEVPGTHSNHGLALASLGRFEEADEAFGRALEIDPRNVDAHQNLGESMRRQGRDEEAVEQFRRVLEVEPDNDKAWAGLGHSYIRIGRHEEAVEAANRALSLDRGPSNTAALHLLLGRALREDGQFRTAERHLLQAAEQAPDSAEPQHELANLYLRMERFAEASAHTARARELEPDSVATLHTRAETIRRQKQHEESLPLYREALEIEPEYAPALAGMGIALFDLERYPEAVDSLEQALDIDAALPEAADLNRLLGRALQQMERLEEAVGRFEDALALDSLDTVALDHLAFLHFNAGRYEQALERYQALVRINDDNALAHANLGITLLNLGRHQEAVTTLERSLELDSEQPTARAALADARQRAAAGAGSQ